jgi:hypothetical protein
MRAVSCASFQRLCITVSCQQSHQPTNLRFPLLLLLLPCPPLQRAHFHYTTAPGSRMQSRACRSHVCCSVVHLLLTGGQSCVARLTQAAAEGHCLIQGRGRCHWCVRPPPCLCCWLLRWRALHLQAAEEPRALPQRHSTAGPTCAARCQQCAVGRWSSAGPHVRMPASEWHREATRGVHVAASVWQGWICVRVETRRVTRGLPGCKAQSIYQSCSMTLCVGLGGSCAPVQLSQ